MWEQDELTGLYQAVFHRKSVRKYAAEPLPDELLAELGKATQKTVPLSPGEKAAFRVLEHSHLKGIISAKAPHYLAVYAGPGEEAITSAAFQLQQMDLWLSARGIGSCWLGMPKPALEAAKAAGMDFVVVLAFGTPAEEVHRSDLSQFKRKTLGEISNIDNSALDELLEPVRLAPSGSNRQPWYLTAGPNAVQLHGKKNNLITKAIYGNMPLLDVGIALCHLWLAGGEKGVLDRMEAETGVTSPPGYGYVWSLMRKELD